MRSSKISEENNGDRRRPHVGDVFERLLLAMPVTATLLPIEGKPSRQSSLDRVRPSTYDGGRLFPPRTMPLTPHQRTTLSYIREFQHKRGYSPSLSDLALAFGVRSKNAIAKVVNALVKG